MTTTGMDTKHIIAEAMIDLARHRNIEKITVKDVAEAANVSRRTFYIYFSDLPDAMEWVLEDYADRLIERCLSMSRMEDALYVFAKDIAGNTALMTKVLDSKYRAGAEELILRAVKKLIYRMMEEEEHNYPIAPDQSEFVIDLISCMFTGYIIEHNQKKDISVEQVCSRFLWLFDRMRGTVALTG